MKLRILYEGFCEYCGGTDYSSHGNASLFVPEPWSGLKGRGGRIPVVKKVMSGHRPGCPIGKVGTPIDSDKEELKGDFWTIRLRYDKEDTRSENVVNDMLNDLEKKFDVSFNMYLQNDDIIHRIIFNNKHDAVTALNVISHYFMLKKCSNVDVDTNKSTKEEVDIYRHIALSKGARFGKP